MKTNESNIFMLGIGGMGMTPLAIYLRQMGCAVCGFDDHLRPPVGALLQSAGVEWIDCPVLPENTETIVYSSAISAQHPLLIDASRRGLPLLRRGEMMAKVLAPKKVVAVVGSHGKTTTAGLLAHSLLRNRFPFGYLVGGLFEGDDLLPARYSESEWVVAEIDESDGTIDLFQPEITLVLNLDWDHADYYTNLRQLEETFKALIQRTNKALFLPANCEKLNRLCAGAGIEKIRLGPGGDYNFEFMETGLGFFKLGLGGRFPQQSELIPLEASFNAENALAALAVSHYLIGSIRLGSLEKFSGIRRRQKKLFDSDGWVVFEDYAHHPREIEAMIRFAREAYADRQLRIVFQPHRFSRTLRLKMELARSLEGADELFLLDVYPASEDPLEGGTIEDLIECFAEAEAEDLYPRKIASYTCLSTLLKEKMEGPSVVLFLGAGDIDQWADAFVRELLEAKEPKLAGFAPHPGNNNDNNNSWWEKLRLTVDAETSLSTGVSLADKTTLRVGGPAFFYAEPAGVEDLSLLLKSAAARSLPVYFLGRGSNLLVPDDGFKGLVIRLNHPSWRIIEPLEGGRLWVGGGARLKQICGEACRLGLAGLEFLEGIPGSLGGSLRMNAGVMGGWIFDVVEEVQFMTLGGVLKTLPRVEIEVGYRECRELLQTVAVGAVLRTRNNASSGSIRATLEEFSRKRKSSQPREPSVGCIFKNPEDSYAGRIIDELGLKGLRVGAAEVSQVHGNFIINRGGATCVDVVRLIRNIRREVQKRTGIELQPEVLLMGKNWEQVL